VTRRVVAALKPLGGCLAAGLIVGLVVAGIGSRLVMRLLAMADGSARGSFTENGNQVGDITLGGTLGLIAFVGIPTGVLAGLVVFAVRRWLPESRLWRGLAFSAVLLGLLGGTVIDPDNVDFLILEPPQLAVALFGLLFLAAGFMLPALAERWGPGIPRALYRTDVTAAGAILIGAVTVFGLVQLGRDIAELV
jgi:hypothetical protein